MRIVYLCFFNEANRIFSICTSFIVPLVCSPKFCLTMCSFTLGTTEISGEFNNKDCAKFFSGGGGGGGANKVYYGRVQMTNSSMLRKIRKIIEKRYLLQQGAQKLWPFWFIHILSYRFNPIRSQMETVLRFWLVNVYIKECELIKGGHTFGVPAVKGYTNHTSWDENFNSSVRSWK